MKIYSLTGFPSALTGSFTGSFFGDGSGLTGTDSGSWDGDFVGSAKITGSLSLSGSFKDQESSTGTAGQVLSSTVSGSQWIDIEDPDAVTGEGDVGTIPKWATTTSLGNSIITEAASAITVGGAATFSGNVDIIKTTSDAAGELRIGGILASDNLPFGIINFANTAAANSQVNDILAYIAGEKTGSSNRADLTFATSNDSAPVERLRISSGGDVGIGVTPSNWEKTSGSNALQFLGGYIYNYRDGNLISGNGAYYDGTWKYYKTGIGATKFNSGNGAYDFAVASSGTVNDPITWVEALTISSGGAATFTGLINANQGVEVVDTTAGSAGTPNFKTILDYKSFTNRATIKGGNEASGTQGTYLKFYVNNLTTANSPLNLLTLQSSFVNGTNAQFDALIKANNGISFPNQSSPTAGSISSSTLDAYEEGTWTPTLTDVSNNPATLNTTNSVGVYTRIGNLVYYRVTIQITSLASTSSTSTAFIKGFPYVSATIPGNWFRPQSTIIRNITFSGYVALHINANFNYGYLFDNISGATGGSLEFSSYANNSTITSAGVYEI
tara:strand:+ start:2310 stop:3977 length:1668 start_codon:yes stop_codon:yes gene_type:complete